MNLSGSKNLDNLKQIIYKYLSLDSENSGSDNEEDENKKNSKTKNKLTF